MLRHILLLLSGNAATSLMLFARNLILARLVSVEDYGIASTFAIAMAVVEVSTQFGLQVQIVQDKKGEDPDFQAALQGFQVLRGVISGVILFFAAGAIADFMNIPDVAWAYQMMALIPVLRSLQHFDIHRLNRDMRFAPLVLTSAMPALASLLALWPLAAFLNDYRVMLYALLLQGFLETLTSHVLAERRYRLVLDRAVIAESVRFGWPLLLNGVLLFLVFQGDKVIVGRELGIEVLAVVAMGFTLTLTPTQIVSRSIRNLFLTHLSRYGEARRETPTAFQDTSEAAIQGNLLGGTAVVVGALLLGPWFVGVFLGDDFKDLSWMLIWLAIQQGIRVFKNGPNLVSLALGFTGNALASNLVRVVSLGATWWAATSGHGLPAILAIAIVAELLGWALSLVLMQTKVSMMMMPLLPSHLSAIGVAVMAGFASGAANLGFSEKWAAGALWSCLAMFGLLLFSSRAFLRHFRNK
jgi:O-antigen/teichoic acid export membrane protein